MRCHNAVYCRRGHHGDGATTYGYMKSVIEAFAYRPFIQFDTRYVPENRNRFKGKRYTDIAIPTGISNKEKFG